MPCSAPPRGFTDTKLPWSDVINNNPCGGKVLQRAGLVDPLADSPRALWKLDEAGGLVYDSVGALVGTPTAGVTLGVPGRIGTAASFDGVGGINVPYNAAVDVADVFTVECWALSTGLTAHGGTQYTLVCRPNAGGFVLRASVPSSSRIELLIQAGGIVCTSGVVGFPQDGQWHHVAATKNGATSKMYLDGVDVTQAGTNFTGTTNSGFLNIGFENAGTRQWQGAIDGVAVYNTALTLAQIQGHVLGKDVSADGLCQFHYRMKYGAAAVQQPITVEP